MYIVQHVQYVHVHVHVHYLILNGEVFFALRYKVFAASRSTAVSLIIDKGKRGIGNAHCSRDNALLKCTRVGKIFDVHPRILAPRRPGTCQYSHTCIV